MPLRSTFRNPLDFRNRLTLEDLWPRSSPPVHLAGRNVSEIDPDWALPLLRREHGPRGRRGLPRDPPTPAPRPRDLRQQLRRARGPAREEAVRRLLHHPSSPSTRRLTREVGRLPSAADLHAWAQFRSWPRGRTLPRPSRPQCRPASRESSHPVSISVCQQAALARAWVDELACWSTRWPRPPRADDWSTTARPYPRWADAHGGLSPPA